MECPRDKISMESNDGICSCSQCHGTFLGKDNLGPEFYQIVKKKFWQTGSRVHLSCPACGNKMKVIEYKKGLLQLDICFSCKGVWFDEDEINTFEKNIKNRVENTPIYLSKKDKKNNSKALEAYDKYQQYKAEKKHKASVFEALFQIITSLPIEENMRSINKPIVTYTLVVINILIFIITAYFLDLSSVFLQWAFVPQQTPLIPNGIYSMFFHAGIFHIFGNMYFLIVLGDNVEDVMGRWWFLGLYFMAGLAGFLLADKVGPFMIPHVGASGAIAGIMAAYFFLFPKAKFVVRFFFVIVFPISSLVYFGFWFGYQLLMYFISPDSGVSWASHVAGFSVGMLLVIIFKKKNRINRLDT